MKRFFYLLLSASLLVSCTKVKGPEFRQIGHFRVKSVDLSAATIGFQVTYFNPNNFGVTVKEAAVDIYADSLFLGKFVQDSSVQVSKSSEFSIPLAGPVPLSTVLKLDLKNLPTRNILLRVDGSVKVGKAGIFVNQPVHYSGMHRLDEIKIRL